MAVVATSQRRFPGTDERSLRDRLSARLYGRLRDNVNNQRQYVSMPMLILQHWPDGITIPATANTDLQYVAQWPKLCVPRPFTGVRFFIGAIRTAGAGTVTVGLRLHRALQRNLTEEDPPTGTVVVNSGTHAFYATTVTPIRSLVGDRNWGPTVFPLLTAQASDLTTTVLLRTVKAWCVGGS